MSGPSFSPGLIDFSHERADPQHQLPFETNNTDEKERKRERERLQSVYSGCFPPRGALSLLICIKIGEQDGGGAGKEMLNTRSDYDFAGESACEEETRRESSGGLYEFHDPRFWITSLVSLSLSLSIFHLAPLFVNGSRLIRWSWR